MSEIIFYDTLRQGLWVAVIISAPVLAGALISGLLIGLFQALTSIQEMTLTFVPKVGTMLIIFTMTISFMTETLVSFFQSTIIPMVIGG